MKCLGTVFVSRLPCIVFAGVVASLFFRSSAWAECGDYVIVGHSAARNSAGPVDLSHVALQSPDASSQPESPMPPEPCRGLRCSRRESAPPTQPTGLTVELATHWAWLEESWSTANPAASANWPLQAVCRPIRRSAAIED